MFCIIFELNSRATVHLWEFLPAFVSADKKAFFLVSTSPAGPQIYELVAQTSSDRKAWVQYVTEAAAASGANKTRSPPLVPPKPREPKKILGEGKEEEEIKPDRYYL